MGGQVTTAFSHLELWRQREPLLIREKATGMDKRRTLDSAKAGMPTHIDPTPSFQHSNTESEKKLTGY